jgi:phosphoribosyl-AMP cyclohydrolase
MDKHMNWLDEVKWDAQGLVPVIAQEQATGDVLMFAWMNREALQKTAELGRAVYFSRSRGKLWKKGESSGHLQRVTELRVDCDQDAIWLRVEQEGAGACHTGRRSCFYRTVPVGQTGEIALEFRDGGRTFDPAAVYQAQKSS